MAKDTPQTGETGATPQGEEELKNEQANQGTPPEVKTEVKTEGQSEVEKLRKEKEQAEMRANQLANQLKAKEQVEEETRKKELEQKQEFKSLYEQEQAKREELERTIEEEKKQKEIDKASKEIFSEYSDGVREIAEETGLVLSELSDEAKAALKSKLDVINSKVVKSEKNSPNNPGNKTPSENSLSPDEFKEALRTEEGFHELIQKKYPGIANMTKRS